MSDRIRNTPRLGSLQRQPRLSDTVAQRILDTIVSRHLRPGDALPPERELGEQFGVSRTVIREAVRALDARGLLEVRVGSRIKVAAVDPTTVSDAIVQFVRSHEDDGHAVAEISAALDIAAAGLAAKHATEDDRQRIATAAEDLERGRANSSADSTFRGEVIASAHSDLLTVLAETMANLRQSTPTTAEHSFGATSCRALAQAIRRRNAKQARRAAMKHLA